MDVRFIGKWRGTLSDDNSHPVRNCNYESEIHIQEAKMGDTAGESHYFVAGCNRHGELKLIRETADRIELQETIVEGRSARHSRNGTLTLTLDGRRLQVLWIDQSDSE